MQLSLSMEVYPRRHPPDAKISGLPSLKLEITLHLELSIVGGTLAVSNYIWYWLVTLRLITEIRIARITNKDVPS